MDSKVDAIEHNVRKITVRLYGSLNHGFGKCKDFDFYLY